jgi:signal transduction histidine kinase
MARILIVDDERSIRTTLSAFLQDEGYEVEVAEDVGRAQELLSLADYDVVVSDIILPRVTGVALLKQIRKTAPDVQVIMMTGEPTVETAVESVREGAHDYLTKPVGKSAILRTVAHALKIKKLEDENREHREHLEQLVETRTHELSGAVTKLKKAQQQLIQQERMNALGQMASGIAHDFNNVLMPIIGFSEMLLSDPKALDDREELIHMLEMIHSAGGDAKHIVSRMRQIYKEEDPQHGPVDLAKVMESVISITMPKWKEEMNAKGANIEIVTEFEDAPLIKGNTSELREALTNLVFNAVDAIPDGGTITLRLKSVNGSGVVLEVSDTGIGMDETTSRHCIEPFFTTKGVQGTGLGLPMVHGILQRHGGSLEVDSKRGEGTTMRMRFPVPIELDLAEDSSETQPEPLPPLSALVIDDEARSRDLISRLLVSDGHIVKIAEGGRDGVAMMARGEEFDLVITDRAMPLMSGDEVAAEIAKHWPGTPVIMLTGFGDMMNDEGECPPGVSYVMTKPVTNNDLRHVMTRIMKSVQSPEPRT